MIWKRIQFFFEAYTKWANTFSPSSFLLSIPDGGGGAPGRGDGRKRRQPARKNDRNQRDGNRDGRNNRRTSLRIGGGRAGRAASLTSRRGSLKKRDRRAEKEARFEAAMERRRVVLPE